MTNLFSKKLIIVYSFLALFIIIIIVSLIFLPKKDENKNQSNASTSNIETKFYRNDQAGISFSYPQSYGEIEEEDLLPNNSNGLIKQGEALKLTFEKNRDLSIILASQDFEGFKENRYTGNESFSSVCTKPLIIDATGNSCYILNLDEQKFLVRTEYIVDEGVSNLLRTFSLNLPGDKFTGLKVIQSFPKIYEELNSLENDQKSVAIVSFAKQLIKEEAAPEVIAKSLTEINNLIESIKVSNQR